MTDVQDNEAMVVVTYDGMSGDLRDPVPYDATDTQILGWVRESLQGGSVEGIPAQNEPNLQDYVVQRVASSETVQFNRLMVRPKTPFGR